MSESAKRHEENSNLIKEIRASTDATIRNQRASIKTLEIQIRQMSKVLQKRGFGSLPSSTEANPRDQVKLISTTIEADSYPICRIRSSQYVVSTKQNRTLMYETRQTMIPFLSRLNGYYCEEKKGSYGPQFSEAYSEASQSIPRKEKDPRSFTLPCFINNVCFDNALVDLGASISVVPFSTYLNLGLGELAHTKLTVELADKTVKYPNGIVENVLVGIEDTNNINEVNTANGVSTAAMPITLTDKLFIINTDGLMWAMLFNAPALLAASSRSRLDLEESSSLMARTCRVSKVKVNTVKVNGVNTARQTTVCTVKGNGVTAVKASAGCVWRPKMTDLNNGSKDNSGSWISKRVNYIDPQGRLKGIPQQALSTKNVVDSGCSRHMTGNKALLTDYQDIDGGFIAFGGSTRGGKITGIGKIRTNKIDFEDVFFVKELKFNLFSVSQMCDKKNSVLFTETECLVLSPDFKLIDESQVLLRVPRQNNMYNFDLKNVVPSGDLTCLFAKATIDESKLWHRRLGHVNFKTMNKLVKGNLVRGLPSKTFENDHTCVACQKGKQHKASCKTKHVSSISQPLQMLHMDLFGPTSVRSINHKTYCLVVTDDFSSCDDVVNDCTRTKSEYGSALKPLSQEKVNRASSTNNFNTVSTPVNTANLFKDVNAANALRTFSPPHDPLMPELEDTTEMQRTDGWLKCFSLIDTIESRFGLPTSRAWYETLSTYLLDNGFHKGKIDKTLFIKRVKGDILLVQVYVYDIIFGSTRKSLCTDFEQIMHKRFQMSSIGELTFFLSLQVKQKNDGIFISQDKYVGEIMKKFGFSSIRTANTPMETNKALAKDEEGKDVDVYLYRLMIGSLMYLTSSRPDIMFSVCACLRFQVQPKVSYMFAVKRIFRYLKGRPKLGLWYPKDSPFILKALSDSYYAGASLDKKSITGGCQFLGSRLISWQCKKQNVVANSTTEAEYIVASQCCGQVLWIQNQLLDYGYNFMHTKIHVDNERTF
ncbi:uncharacterized mitochondrial protein-like protein [Tanacetum coccineum]